jgi:hypothetical protein
MVRGTLRLPLVASLVMHLAIGVFAVRGVHLATPPAAASSAAAMTGETFDLPVEQPIEFPAGDPAAAAAAAGQATAGSNGGSTGSEASNAEPGSAPPQRRSRPARPAGAHGAASVAGQASGESAATEAHAPAAPYGAAGERGAVDLATAFTRGFPQAASMDSRWVQAPFGPAGEALVVLEIAPNGTLLAHRVTGTPSAALRAGIERTVALIGAREFTATAAETRLRVTATVSPDQVHDGLHGDVFAIGGSFAQAEGNGFFALAIGRRVDVRVRAIP